VHDDVAASVQQILILPEELDRQAVLNRAYAPLFPGFSGVFMENITESYNVT
jgi:hypothetical protein